LAPKDSDSIKEEIGLTCYDLKLIEFNLVSRKCFCVDAWLSNWHRLCRKRPH